MNPSVSTLSLALLFSMQASAKTTQTFPSKLVCVAQGNCVAGYENFCDASIYFPEPVIIEQPETFAADLYDPSEILTEEELQKSVKLDFSQGDQYSFYFFNQDDMSALASGQLETIQGTYEDGFDWVNGYNTRAKFNIECTAGTP